MRNCVALLFAVTVSATPLARQSSETTSHQFARCESRGVADISSYERSARQEPSALLPQIDLAMCYDQAWRFDQVGGAIVNAIEVLRSGSSGIPAVAAPAGARPIAGADVPSPRRTRSAQPDYPRDASAKGTSGLVVLEIVIDTKGEVREAKAAKSIPGLDEAAIKAARKWKYEPTVVGGVPVEVLGYAPVRFGPVTEPITSDWLEIALFHLRMDALDRARAALTIALAKAQEARENWSGYVDLLDNRQTEGVTRPTVTKQVDPRFPRRALNSTSRDGKVVLEALVDRAGNIARVAIVGRSSQFDSASIEAALQWRFGPALRLGKPVPCRVLLEMEFRSR